MVFAPIGVLSRPNSTILLVYNESEVPHEALADQMRRIQHGSPSHSQPEPLWGLSTDYSYPPNHAVYCEDADCRTPGCWAASFPDGETYHCSGCYQPYDAAYQCLTENKRCPQCCGRAACIEAGIMRMGLS